MCILCCFFIFIHYKFFIFHHILHPGFLCPDRLSAKASEHKGSQSILKIKACQKSLAAFLTAGSQRALLHQKGHPHTLCSPHTHSAPVSEACFGGRGWAGRPVLRGLPFLWGGMGAGRTLVAGFSRHCPTGSHTAPTVGALAPIHAVAAGAPEGLQVGAAGPVWRRGVCCSACAWSRDYRGTAWSLGSKVRQDSQ